MHFYRAFLKQAPCWLTLVEPLLEVNVEMILSSPSTTQSAVRGQVFKGASEDHVERPNPNAERPPSPKPPRAQTSKKGLASTSARVKHRTASTKKLVKRTHGGVAKLNLATVSNHIDEVPIALVSLSPTFDLPTAKMEVVVETKAKEGGSRASSEGRELSNLMEEHSPTTEVPSGS